MVIVGRHLARHSPRIGLLRPNYSIGPNYSWDGPNYSTVVGEAQL